MDGVKNNSEIVVINGLGIGEETKGATVQWLTQLLNAHTVLRTGGSQAGHHIINEDGTEQMFSHFGCGTFEGAKTHLTHMVINPVDLFTEALELEAKGIANPLDLISIDGNCLTVTPFHGAFSRFKERLRDQKKGTVGKGVGDAIKDSRTSPDLGITAAEFSLGTDYLMRKVEAIRQHKLQQAIQIISDMGIEELPDEVYSEMKILNSTSLVVATVESFECLAALVQISNDEQFTGILNQEGAIVTEPSHGSLLHPWYGFIPHTTQIDPTSSDLLETLETKNYSGKVIRLGVSRCYMTRHGAGPLVSFSPEMSSAIHETHNNTGNDWLGDFKNGQYDLVAMQYSLAISGGANTYDGLIISYLDVLNQFSEWQVCEAYIFDGIADDLEDYFVIEDGVIKAIKVVANTQDEKHYNHQVRLTELLKQCKPVLRTLVATEDKSLEQVFLEYVEENLKVNVVATSHGPKASDRRIRKGHEALLSRTGGWKTDNSDKEIEA